MVVVAESAGIETRTKARIMKPVMLTCLICLAYALKAGVFATAEDPARMQSFTLPPDVTVSAIDLPSETERS